jgi:flagellar hook assembly protein FlgD
MNSPNPFNASTQIDVVVETATSVRLEIFDVLGRRVSLLVDDVLASGHHVFDWNGRAESGGISASGVYFARLTVDGEAQVRKIMMLK